MRFGEVVNVSKGDKPSVQGKVVGMKGKMVKVKQAQYEGLEKLEAEVQGGICVHKGNISSF